MADPAPFVMAGLDPAILRLRGRGWMAGSSPAMTEKGMPAMTEKGVPAMTEKGVTDDAIG
jgi:hypothetical protein